MHLKSLTLKGFKSFASATTLKFEPGICAVVGPNGSGKSNVVDALAWVMGEQGAKTLRGGKMQDVIFAGAGERKPLGRAEVTLTIDNSDGLLPIDYTEVSITRRMFRDGASEYEINGAKARLMDIQELLSDSGIGREMHVIVGQGRLSHILESRPEERRAFIEEAAGVLKHRRRKEKAQRKLVGMQANLDRLSDLTEELGKQLKPLARQAEAAQKAASVQASVRDARLRLAGERIARLRAEVDVARRRYAGAEEELGTLSTALAAQEEKLLTIDASLNHLNPATEQAQQLWFALSTLRERVSATIRIAAERARGVGQDSRYQGPDPDMLERRAEEAAAEYQGLEEAKELAQERLEAIRDEVFDREETRREAEAEHLAQVRALADKREGTVRLIAQEESLRAQLTAVQTEISTLNEAAAATAQRVATAQREASALAEEERALQAARGPLEEAHLRAASESGAAEKRLEQLRDQQRMRERTVYSLSARIETLAAQVARSTNQDLEQLAKLTPLAQCVRTTSEFALALAAALGSHSTARVGRIEGLLIGEMGEGVRTTIVDKQRPQESWRLDAALPRECTWLLDHVESTPEIAGALNRLLADVVYCPDLNSAQKTVESDPRLRAVTPRGELLGQGWVQVGKGHASPVEVSAQIQEAKEELAAATTQLDNLSGTVQGAIIAAEEARVTAAGAKAALREHDQAAATLKRDVQRLESQTATNKQDHSRAAEKATAAEARLAALEEELTTAQDRLRRVEDDTVDEDPSTEARDEANAALDQVKAMEMEANLALRTAEERLSQAAGKAEALRRQAAHERQARAAHQRATAARRQAALLAHTVETQARTLAERVDKATAQAAARRDELIAQRAEATRRASAAKDALSARRNELARVQEKAHSAQIVLTQATVRRDEAEAKASEQLGVAIADLLADYSPEPDFDRAAEEKRLHQAERALAALGKVNPLALEEYQALQERYTFLSTQLDDVITARRDLSAVIEDVDRQILQLFTDAWHDVERHFPQVFSTLFPGGEGRLLLTEPEDMLATGIEVEARPPGKKVKRLSLLSGGEKSLTALAMLVAIFKARPSPFYVMDEVEAALDDVNLRRLIALFEQLRTDSQLIVITHQKPTMDVANVLYGVTMRGDGITRVISQRMSPAGSSAS